MEIIASLLLASALILIGAFSKRKEQKNKIAASYLLLGSASIPLAIFFDNIYSLILYRIAFVSYILAVVFSLKMKKVIKLYIKERSLTW